MIVGVMPVLISIGDAAMSRRSALVTIPAAFIVAIVVWGVGLVAVASQDGTGGATPAPSPQVERDVLAESEPESAPGQDFALARYVIPAGFVLPVHTHPGVQMAVVESGTLTYHVLENGSVAVTRADGTVEEIGPGESTTLTVGDAWVEPAGMVHYAENLTAEPVILLAASLLDESEPVAIPVEAATPVS